MPDLIDQKAVGASSAQTPEQPRKFRLHRVSIGFIILSGLFYGYCAWQSRHGSTGGYQVGYISGRFVFSVAISALVGFLFYRVFRRSQFVGNALFCIVLLVLSAPAILGATLAGGRMRSPATERARLETMESMEVLEKRSEDIRRKQLTQMQAGEVTTGGLSEYAKAFDEARPKGDSDEAKAAEMGVLVLKKLQPVVEKVEQTTVDVVSRTTSILDMSALDTPEELKDRIRVLGAWKKANADFLTELDAAPVYARTEAAKLFKSKRVVEEAVAGFERGFASTGIRNYRTRIVEFGDAGLALLELLDKEWGKWSYVAAEDRIVLTDGSESTQADLETKTEAAQKALETLTAAEEKFMADAQARLESESRRRPEPQ